MTSHRLRIALSVVIVLAATTRPALAVEPHRLTHSVCAQLSDRRSRILWDAIKQAVWLNIASPSGQGFCAEHATKIVFDQDAREGGTIAASMIDLQLHGGAGPYDADLPRTYLGKIVYDALVRISPCPH